MASATLQPLPRVLALEPKNPASDTVPHVYQSCETTISLHREKNGRPISRVFREKWGLWKCQVDVFTEAESRKPNSYPRTLIFENDNTARLGVGRPIDSAGRNVVKMSICFTCGKTSFDFSVSERIRKSCTRPFAST
jgi:hypothetical protein